VNCPFEGTGTVSGLGLPLAGCQVADFERGIRQLPGSPMPRGGRPWQVTGASIADHRFVGPPQGGVVRMNRKPSVKAKLSKDHYSLRGSGALPGATPFERTWP
jgi:hypothetical protein